MRCRQSLVASVLVLLVAGVLIADLPEMISEIIEPTVVGEADPASQEAATSSPRAPSEQMQQIRLVLTAQRSVIEDLQARLDETTDHAEAAAIQEQISQLKQEGELQILQIQADHARAEGHEALAAELEEVIQKNQSPPSRRQPMPRPAWEPEDEQNQVMVQN